MDQSPSTADSCESQGHRSKSLRKKAKPASRMEKGKGTEEVDSTGCTENPPSDTVPEGFRLIKVKLLEAGLWKKFKSTTNEMIVTKPGR